MANSTESPIYEVVVAVKAFACRAGPDRLEHCLRVVASDEMMPMAVRPGGGGRFVAELEGRAPAGIPDGPLRVSSVVAAIHDGADRKREAEEREPAPLVRGDANDLQEKVDRSIMPVWTAS